LPSAIDFNPVVVLSGSALVLVIERALVERYVSWAFRDIPVEAANPLLALPHETLAAAVLRSSLFAGSVG